MIDAGLLEIYHIAVMLIIIGVFYIKFLSGYEKKGI